MFFINTILETHFFNMLERLDWQKGALNYNRMIILNAI